MTDNRTQQNKNANDKETSLKQDYGCRGKILSRNQIIGEKKQNLRHNTEIDIVFPLIVSGIPNIGTIRLHQRRTSNPIIIRVLQFGQKAVRLYIQPGLSLCQCMSQKLVLLLIDCLTVLS